jgi:hypothetical protein
MFHFRDVEFVNRVQFGEMTGMYVDAFGKSAYEVLVEKLGLEEDTEEFIELLRREKL